MMQMSMNYMKLSNRIVVTKLLGVHNGFLVTFHKEILITWRRPSSVELQIRINGKEINSNLLFLYDKSDYLMTLLKIGLNMRTNLRVYR